MDGERQRSMRREFCSQKCVPVNSEQQNEQKKEQRKRAVGNRIAVENRI